MKRNYKILAIVISLLTMVSACSKFLDRTPEGQLTKEQVFKDEAGLVSFANGIYTYIGDGDFMGGRMQVISDILADQLKGDKFTGDYAEIYGRRNSIFGGTRDAMFLKGYKIINSSNILLENMDVASAKKSYLQGSAYFFRGMAHFELVRLFAQPYGYTTDNSHYGIVIRTQSGLDGMQRATVKQVYDQVIADLKNADALLPDDADAGKFYTASKWIAEAYLAKVYFQMNDFANAYKYADQVIKSGKFQLDADYTSRYSVGLTKEAILRIANEVNHFQPGSELIGNWRSDKAVPTCNFTDVFYNNAVSRANDKRKTWYSNTLQTGYNVLTKYNMDYMELPITHLTEMKLIRAEAGAEISSTNAAALTVAISDINDIMTRAYGGTTNNLPPTATATGVISTVRTERELEMVGEGNRLQEIKRIGVRTGQNVDRRGSPWSCNGFILQFPKSEQDAYAPFILNPEGGCF